MDKVLFVEHDAHMICAFDSKKNQVSGQNLLARYLVTGFVQLLGRNRHLQACLFIDIVDKTAAVEGIRTFRSAAVGLSKEIHRVLNDVFSKLAARLVE